MSIPMFGLAKRIEEIICPADESLFRPRSRRFMMIPASRRGAPLRDHAPPKPGEASVASALGNIRRRRSAARS